MPTTETITTDALGVQLAAAEVEYAALLEGADLGEIDGVKARTRAAARLWHLRAILYAREGSAMDATRAASQAAESERLAIAAAKADLITRVEQLERLVAEARTRGAGVRSLAERADRRARAPGHDPKDQP